MKKFIPVHAGRNVWFGAAAYLLLLAIGFNTLLANKDFPDWVELLFKATILLAFSILVVLPLLYVAAHFRAKKLSVALTTGGFVMLAGYIWFFGWLAYIKLKTCNPQAAPWDGSWYCNVEGEHVIFYFVAIPVVAAVCGLVAEGVAWLLSKFKHSR